MKSGKIGLPAATAVGLGAIIGAGIFTLSGSAIALAGSNALLAFVLVGIVAIIIALELGELGSIMPDVKGASYSYVYKAFGSELGFITGIFRFVSYSTGISAIALGFGAYFVNLFGLANSTVVYFSIMLIVVLTLVNMRGIRKAANADLGLVIIKIGVLAFFILFALVLATHGSTHWVTGFVTSQSQKGIGAIFDASVAIFFAYSGFQTISTFTSRIKNGAKGAANAILLSVIISMVIYILVIIALIALVPANKYTISADPLSFALSSSNAPRYMSIIVDIGALVATASAALSMILGASRTAYQISADGLLPKIFRKYDKERDVAINGVIISSMISVVMLFAGNIYIIAAISNFGVLFSYFLVSFVVVHFRRMHKNATFMTPFYPYLTVIGIVGVLAFMAGMPKEALIFGVVMALVLLVAYYTLREIEHKKVIKIRLFR
ncbi:MAG: APC family permease [Candidatus Marsarchaeota archaeon]|nr:APC family permease [Candidatus Marsarchaeota archaeon]